MTILRGFNHVSFTVGDMDRSLAFYRDLLGMTVEADREVHGPHIAQITGFPGKMIFACHTQLLSTLAGYGAIVSERRL